jgi:hypothetical protein
LRQLVVGRDEAGTAVAAGASKCRTAPKGCGGMSRAFAVLAGLVFLAGCGTSDVVVAGPALDTDVWQDARGNRVPIDTITSYRGPEHCDWQDITFLVLGTGTAERRYLRDTKGELSHYLATTFDPSAALPRQATDTGFERDGRRLWLHPDGTAAYLVDTKNPERVERWPAAKTGFACA